MWLKAFPNEIHKLINNKKVDNQILKLNILGLNPCFGPESVLL